MTQKFCYAAMKSRHNPFPPSPTLRRAHPSQKQSLSKKEKTLSPDRLSHRSRVHFHSLNQGSQQLNKKNDQHFFASDRQPVFTEIWPSTHCESSPGSNTASPKMETTKQTLTSERVSSEAQEDSVLAKYIDRFRHGQPQSREERQQVAFNIGEEEVPFWWMLQSEMSTKTLGKDNHDNSPNGQSPHERFLSVLSDTSQGEFDDTEILQLQDKANRLLLRGEFSPSDGSVPVSSDGLGCSNFSSPVSVDEPVRQPVIPSLIQSFATKDSSNSNHPVPSQKSLITTPTRPEEDILFQWRLRRKMEQAREWPHTLQHSSIHGSAFSWQTTSLNHPSTSGQPCKSSHSDAALQAETMETKLLYPPAPGPQPFPAYGLAGSSVSQSQALTHVPAHMHLLCDVLPCPIRLSHVEGEKNISQRLDEFQATVDFKNSQVPKSSLNITSDGLLEAHRSFPPYASCGATKREEPSHRKVHEKTKKKRAETKKPEKKMAPSITQKRKSARGSSDLGLPKEHHQVEEVQEFPSKSCNVDHKPPPSPVHIALGQVVSEVLFPAVDSSPAQRIPISPVPPPLTVCSQSPVPPCDAQNSLQVISQLLQETEDSDEEEFEDDPLLKVLRQKRRWVKNQISEVDTMLNEFHKEQQVT